MHRASEVDLLLNPLSRWVTKSLFTAATQNNQPWLGTSDPFAKELKNQQRIITDDGAKFVCSMNEGFQKWMKYGGALVLRSWFKSFYSQLHRVYKYINKSFAYCLNRTTSPTLFSRVCGVFFPYCTCSPARTIHTGNLTHVLFHWRLVMKAMTEDCNAENNGRKHLTIHTESRNHCKRGQSIRTVCWCKN